MKNSLLLLTVLLLITSCQSGWVKYGKPSQGTILYYEKNRIVKSANNIVKIWTKSEMDISGYKDLTRGYLKTRLILQEIDCTGKKSHLLEIHDYLTNDKKESTIYDKQGWQSMRSGDRKVLYEAACGVKEPPADSAVCADSKGFIVAVPEIRDARVTFNTPEELVSYFIAALNENDEAKLKKTIHPASMREITHENETFYKIMFEEELGYRIPQDVEITYGKVDRNDFLDEFDTQKYCYPVRPSDNFSLNFMVTEATGRILTKYIIKTESGWFIVLPRPKEKQGVQDELRIISPTTENPVIIDFSNETMHDSNAAKTPPKD